MMTTHICVNAAADRRQGGPDVDWDGDDTSTVTTEDASPVTAIILGAAGGTVG
jgi:hypothetical protein